MDMVYGLGLMVTVRLAEEHCRFGLHERGLGFWLISLATGEKIGNH